MRLKGFVCTLAVAVALALPARADTPEQRMALDLLTQVRLADIEALRQVGENGERAALKVALDKLIAGLPQLSDIISRRYFSLTEEQPQRVHTRLAP